MTTPEFRAMASDILDGKSTGFTVSPTTPSPVICGWAVGGELPEVRVALTDTCDTTFLAAMLAGYAAMTPVNGALGGWVHDGHLYLDCPTIVTTSEADALALAAERGELAIYNLNEGAEVTVPRAAA